MQQDKYEEVTKVTQVAEIKTRTPREGIDKIDLSSIKAEYREREKKLAEQKKEIDSAIKNANSTTLPKKTIARYEKEFGKQKEKNAFKTALCLFIVALALGFILQPSIFFVKETNGLALSNYSGRTIKNVSVYSFNDVVYGSTKPLYFIEKISPHETLPMTDKKTTVFLAFAERQMPAIGLYTPDANQNINNGGTGTNYKTGQTPEEMLKEMMNKNEVDANAGQ